MHPVIRVSVILSLVIVSKIFTSEYGFDRECNYLLDAT
jgi:hypothetical protein